MSKTRIEIPFYLPIRAVIISAALFSFACNTAAPPKPVSMTTPDDSSKARTVAKQKAIGNAMDVPIATLDGTTFKLADYKGKIMVVDFWATFCPPCVKQAPQLAELSKRYRDKGVEVIGLTSDEKSDQEKVKEFIKRVGINYQIGYANNWVSGAFLKGTEDETETPPLPQLFIISRDGRVIEHLIGDSPQHGVQYLEKVVTQELSK